MLERVSFRQLLVAAFLLIAGLLAAASLRAVFTLEQLTMQSRDGAVRALDLSAAAQSLNERSVTMERTARQSLVLSDRVLRQRFDEAAADARTVLTRLGPQNVPAALVTDWKKHLQAVTALLSGSPDTALDRDRQVAQEFRELDRINAAIAQQVRQTIARQNRSLLDTLEDRRRQLTQQVLGAIGLAVLMALAFGIWLTRPLNRLEKAIIGLGENRLDEAIRIDGPADLQLVGQRLEWLRLRLVELDADKSRFLRHVSHELKTPLASLREGVSLLEDGVAGELSANQREVAKILRHNTGLLQGQIEDLLRFNAAAFEARQLRREKTDLLQLIEEQVEGQRLQWRARDLQVSVEGPALQAEVDRDKLGTAIANLLSNAIRFSPAGGRIRIRLSQLTDVVHIDMDDEGPGIAYDDQARIFEPFYRGERQPPQVVRGSGIGLSIVHEYIAAHGGRVQLLPDGPGAHFRIELPHAFKS
ncbi:MULTISPECIES: ATP-binding protein [unclassified Polaromonas]|jgi:two-component system sensor histidine kinase GlrK|uniref:sensor histidine kinase n=1 Tax=unclassified Polaromonas TaxID=2638319 RepID=UPI000BD592F3|nr:MULTISPECIES: ATP-binding protein [unclassified Polaromonas]OYY36444.1 MAG: two-component sensor histidine kinase [Polaromonas sp. 35-63-35]OYZ22679.1 MAG: two-component sensor histidine kinase [Polaromonas sp. 16-63-31]OYZ81108.1 MAG: two-component sensor histidine kinase [Polaromonas sp. 24-63-21]OZA52673.1 MAG: two-component sensor histidine kinase [Polaromonas sp. 17-63-33]OZA88472.1 MAG: two-component sensor histidine kinase [Polaromonas sp. 39-63-25]